MDGQEHEFEITLPALSINAGFAPSDRRLLFSSKSQGEAHYKITVPLAAASLVHTFRHLVATLADITNHQTLHSTGFES